MPKILLVFDSTQSLERVKHTINSSLYDLIAVSTGADAIKIIEDENIDLIIADINIGAFDGWKLTRLIRSNIFKLEKNIPVILLSQLIPENLNRVTIRDFGVNSFLSYNNLEAITTLIPQFLRDPEKNLEKPKALIIEDHINNGQLIKRILQSRFDVDLAMDGEEGLTMWEENRHNIVLLDVMLPKLSGKSVLSRMMKIDPEQLVIIITAHGTTKIAQEMMLNGASDFVSKPFKAEDLRLICELVFKRKDFMAWHRSCEKKGH